MDLHELKLFYHLSESLHFGRTSQTCNISPSALSRAIQRLERETGQSLFERDNRSVSLTSAGLKLKQYAAETLERWDLLQESFLDEETVLKGELVLYSSVTACYSILPDILGRFREKYPEIHITLKTGDSAQAIPMVNDGLADISVAALPGKLSSRLRFKEITRTPLVFIAPTVPCAVSRSISTGNINWEDIPLILPERGLARKRAEKWFRSRNIIPSIYAQVSGNEAILAMVHLGCGVGVVPELVVEKSPLRSDIRKLPVQPDLDPYTVGICIRVKRMESPLVRAFWNTVDESRKLTEE